MLHARQGQKMANVVCFHSYTRDRRLISVPEAVPRASTGVLQRITMTGMETGAFALVNYSIVILKQNKELLRKRILFPNVWDFFSETFAFR